MFVFLFESPRAIAATRDNKERARTFDERGGLLALENLGLRDLVLLLEQGRQRRQMTSPWMTIADGRRCPSRLTDDEFAANFFPKTFAPSLSLTEKVSASALDARHGLLLVPHLLGNDDLLLVGADGLLLDEPMLRACRPRLADAIA